MNKALIEYKGKPAGVLKETDEGYEFTYDKDYLADATSFPVSLTLPLSEKPYKSKSLFPFFDGLIPEGWLLDVALRNTDISELDRFSILLLCCKDCIGAVSVTPIKEDNDE
ncbi:MAG: HipA N-terminal domain-containing protein [Bacteroidaceae bacterium]|nr:HipA N-terminal domain-containing protein [Bacteroidaceae bacterium]